MIEQLLALPKKESWVRKLVRKLYFFFWLKGQRSSQKIRIKKAKRFIKVISQAGFRDNPAQFFGTIRKLDPFVFEEALLLAFKHRGFKVIHNKRYTGDGGIDGVVIIEKKRYAIQAKRYSNAINPKHVRDFKGAIIKHRCAGGLLIHCGRSGKGLYDNLDSTIHLISGKNLHQLFMFNS